MVMRKAFTLFTLLSMTSAVANDNGEAQYLQVISSKNPLFKSAMEVQGVRDMYSECYQIDAQNGKLEEDEDTKLSTCLWNKIKADEGVKDKVMELVNKQSGDSGTGRYRTTMETTKKQSAGLKGLKEFFQKRLEEALYGEYQSDKGRFEKIADQRTFFELYKTQLGKNIIASMTSYCIDSSRYPMTSESGGKALPLISPDASKMEEDRNDNLKSLNNFDGKDIEASKTWSQCITSINKICAIGNDSNRSEYKVIDPKTGTESNKLTYQDALDACENRLPDDTSDKEKVCIEIVDNSNARACNVTQYIELAKQSLLATNKIVDKMDLNIKAAQESGASSKWLKSAGAQNVEFYNSSKNADESIDALTTISSGQALEAMSEGHQQEVMEMEKCFKDGTIVDEESCSKYLSSDKEGQYALLGELKIQQELTLEKLDNIENNPEEVAKLLVEEGYTKEQAESLAAVAGVKEQIRNRYDAKKNAILESLRKEIEAHTTTGDEFDAVTDQGKIKAIADEINNRPENFSKLVHYNNIVSSFLKVTSTDKDGNKVDQANTATLSAEMKNSFLSEENREKYEEMGVDLSSLGYTEENLGERFAAAGVDYSEANSDDAVLEVKDINSYILNIFVNDNQKQENSRGTSSD